MDRSLILPSELVPDSQQELQGAHISPELATNGPEPLFVISPKPVLDHEWHIYEKTTDQPNVGSLAYVAVSANERRDTRSLPPVIAP